MCPEQSVSYVSSSSSVVRPVTIPTTKSLSSFDSFELAPMMFSDAINAEPGKVAEAQ